MGTRGRCKDCAASGRKAYHDIGCQHKLGEYLVGELAAVGQDRVWVYVGGTGKSRSGIREIFENLLMEDSLLVVEDETQIPISLSVI